MAQIYFGEFSGYEAMLKDFTDYGREPDLSRFPPESAILFAAYGGAMYEGEAMVLFEQDGALYEVYGSHCSCYGLEGQWVPALVTWEALAMRPIDDRYRDLGREANETLRALILAHTSAKV